MSDEEKDFWKGAAGGFDPAFNKEPRILFIDDDIKFSPLLFLERMQMHVIHTELEHAMNFMNACMAIPGEQQAKMKRDIIARLQLGVDEAQATDKWKPLPSRSEWDRGSAGRGRRAEGIAAMINRLQHGTLDAPIEEAT